MAAAAVAQQLTPEELTELAEFASSLADAAREVILPYWRKPIEIESKIETERAVAESPVTEADRSTELRMRGLIERRYPEHGVYGEEFGSVRTDARLVWVLDPIDGTKSFITGKPLFGTLIACLHYGVPVVGVIDQCVLDERWVGIQGQGTCLNGKPVKTAGCASLSEAMMYATTPHMFSPGFEQERYQCMCDRVKRPLYGADCYAYALVASGFGADLVVEAGEGVVCPAISISVGR
jgi:inositol-phosphate phosphatase/L-galactose 1-phosphate phosphatase/histidinol-phosphatase